jgi:hypothetical protein
MTTAVPIASEARGDHGVRAKFFGFRHHPVEALFPAFSDQLCVLVNFATDDF